MTLGLSKTMNNTNEPNTISIGEPLLPGDVLFYKDDRRRFVWPYTQPNTIGKMLREVIRVIDGKPVILRVVPKPAPTGGDE